MNLPPSILEAFDDERARFDGYKGPLFKAVESAMSEPLTDDWQPISTIPKDGTPVLVCDYGMSYPEIAWHEETGATMRAYFLWKPLPEVPSKP